MESEGSSSDTRAHKDLPRQPLERRWHISFDGTVYGPFQGRELRAMVRQGRLLANDYVIEEGAENWELASEADVVRTFFGQDRPVYADYRRGDVSSGYGRVFFWTAIPLFVITWLVWPYYSLYSLLEGARKGDIAILENGIDWDAVRQGIKADANSEFLRKQLASMATETSTSGQIGTGLAMMLGPSLLNQAVDSFVTPSGFANLIRLNKSLQEKEAKTPYSSAKKNTDRELSWKRIKYAFFSGSPFTFLAKLNGTIYDQPHTIDLIFKWSGGWRLTRIYVPEALLNSSELFKSKPDTTNNLSQKPANEEKAYLTTSEIGSIRKKLANCWTPPAGAIRPVRIRMQIKRDGYLAATPKIEDDLADPAIAANAASAVAAVQRCQPFLLPESKYQAWKDLEITFDPTLSSERK